MKTLFASKNNAINLRRYEVSVTTADGVLNDPLALPIEDDTAEGEQGFVPIARNTFGRLMVVVYMHRGEDICLISVRHAEPKERRAYES